MVYNLDVNPGTLPYLGATTFRNLVDLDPDMAARLHLERMRREWSVRRLAQDISLITDAEATARRLAHGDSPRHDASGLRITHQALAKIDRLGLDVVMGKRTQPIPIGLATYALITHWLGVEPAFEKIRQQAFYESRWLPVYQAELKRQGRG